ncbi:hypothetical protein RND71_009521 [Anisodus tanguticus]|uniref:Uncharacterized protein n=1 Tax=Anisodus tanguticus TaxID=243964 RepID=A0AAE1VN00_9SOLA|nr:hypothetical protein RND71_009521 [Anisodus tanguticus]
MGKKDVFLWNPSIRVYKKLPDFGTNLSTPLIEVKIYSLKDDSWRSVSSPPLDGVGLFGSGKFVNRKLHCANHAAGDDFDKGWNIISIDLVEWKWETVEQPCNGEEEGVLVLGVLGDNLSVLSNISHRRSDIDV